MKLSPTLAGALLALTAVVYSSNATAYSQIIAFGDSLSDNGNLKASTGIPTAPYFDGRLSNGPVAVEVMAQQLGLPLIDYAFAGAFTGTGNLAGAILDGTGMSSQVSKFGSSLSAAQTSADASALYFVWGGANDFFSGKAAVVPVTASNAADNIKADIAKLYQLGARDFFVPLLPDLGLTPWAYKNEASLPGGLSMVATNDSLKFNGLLTVNLNKLIATLPGIHIQTFDTLSFLRNQIGVLSAAGGNVTDQCFSGAYAGGGAVCSSPDSYLFWDEVHPTKASNEVLGQAFAAAVVPEPGSWLLLLAGAASMAMLSARQRVTRRHS